MRNDAFFIRQLIWLSVIYGLYHGLIYLPVMLSWFGPDAFTDILQGTDTDSSKPNHEKSPGHPEIETSYPPTFQVPAIYNIPSTFDDASLFS